MNISDLAILIWDTNGIDSVVRGIVFRINNTGLPGSAPNREEEFLEVFRGIFDGFKNHLQVANHTSDRVFSDEVNPQLPGCYLRNGHPLVEGFCTKNDFADRFSASIEDQMPCENASDGEIADLQDLMDEDLGRKDVSLIVVALKLANGAKKQVAVVTDDVRLAAEIITLKARHSVVNLDGTDYETGWVTPWLSLEILRELHLSCGIDDGMWQHMMLSFKEHHNGRYGVAARGHVAQVVKFLEAFQSDCEEKARRAITREAAEAFGEDNG